MAKKYLVLRDNHGFKGRYWTKDDVVEFPDDVTPPKHFELITKKTKLPEGADASKPVNTMSELQRQSISPEKTAGELMKDQKQVGQVPLSDAEKKTLEQSGSEL